MMFGKVVLACAAAAATLGLSTATVAAAPGQTVNNGPIENALPFSCEGGFTGVTSYSGTGNSTMHFNENRNGDWGTGTSEGTVTLVIAPFEAAPSTYYGHAQDWGAQEDNNNNTVQHGTFNFDGVNLATGAPFHLHGNFDLTFNASDTMTAFHFNVRCS